MNPYHILLPRNGVLFSEQLESLKKTLISVLGSVQKYHIVCAKFFLSDIRNQYDELIESDLYQKYFARVNVSIVEQSPLDYTKIAVIYKVSRQSFEEFVFQPLRLTPAETAGSCYEQTKTLLNRYAEQLEARGLDMATNLVRTWIYVADIDHDYADVARARNEVFAEHGLTPQTHFVASTDIAGATEQPDAKVAIDFLTFPGIKESDNRYLMAPEYLNAAHEYGAAFERGTCLTTRCGSTYYISGTASVNKQGKAIWRGNVKKQFDRVLDNIYALLEGGGSDLSRLDYLIVYLRDATDYDWALRAIRRIFRDTPLVLLQAKASRPEWLIEIEAVAH